MPHAAKLSFNGDPNIGLYGVATDKFAIFGLSVPQDNIKEIKDVLNVPVIQANIYGTPLVGIFIAANSNVVLIPDVIFDHELNHLKKELKGIVEIKLIKTEHTALANNILANDKVAIISTELSKSEIKGIEKALNVKSIQTDLAELNTPGSAGILINKGGFFSPNLSESEIRKVEKLVGFEIGLGSVNMGSPIVGSGVIANSNGFLVGGLSSGYEISRIDESLGFLK